MTADAGIPIARPTVSVPVKLDPQGRLDEDISCRKCGYNLRGLSPNGRCPECGTAVGRSLEDDSLRFADPQWVQTLASGMNWVLAGIATSIVDSVVGVYVANGATISLAWAFLIGFGSGLINLVGYWRVTTPDPGSLEDTSPVTARKVVRIVQIARLAVLAIQALVVVFHIPLAWPAVIAEILVSIVGTISVFTYGRQLARRIPDQMMVRHCGRIMCGVIILLLMQFTTLGAPRASTGPSFCVLVAPWIILLVWSIHLIELFRKAFQEAARLSAAAWAASPPTPSAPSLHDDGAGR